MTEQELAEIRQRANAATPGPWSMKQDGAEFYIADRNGRWLDVTLSDAIFISHARQDIPALLAEVERLRADIEHVSTVGESLAASLDSVKAYNARLRAALDDMLLLIAEHGTKIMWSHNTRITAARNAPKGGSQ